MKQPNEAAMIALLQKRDETALEAIRDEYGKLCGKLAFDIIGCREDAEECVSDMLLKVWQTIPPL